MSIFNSELELQCLFDDLVEGFRKIGKSFDWIEEHLSDETIRACEEVKESESEK